MYEIKKKLGSGNFFQMVINILMLLFLLVELYPLLYVVSCSLSDPNAVAAGKVLIFPVGFTLEGYKLILEYKEIWIGYANTIFYTVIGTVISLAVTLPCAYALSRKNLPGRKFFMLFFMITMYISGGLIPSYLNMKGFGLVNTRAGIIIVSALSVYNLIVAKSFFENTIPEELIDAGRIDGCNDFSIFSMIVLPLSKAITVVMVLYYGIARWNSYFNEMIYLEDRNKFPLQMFLREILLQAKILKETELTNLSIEEALMLTERAKSAELIKYCVIIAATLPMMMIYPKLQKYFEKGIMIGSVKG